MFARVRTYNQRFAAIEAQVKLHPARFPTLAVNCEFLPATSLLFMAFGKALPKDLMARLCGENS
jgi:hypothetical protein